MRTRSERYDNLSARLAELAAAGAAGTPAVCVIRPPAGSLMISQMENRRNALAIAGSHGMRAAWMALAGEDPELLSIPTGYPRRHRGSPEPSTQAAARRVGERV